MAASTLFAKQVWIAGEREVNTSIPRNTVEAEILFDRSSLVGAESPDAMFLDVWLSFDNGATWSYAGGAGFPDGVRSGKCGMRLALPQPQNNQRRVRVVFRTGRTVNVAVTLELF